MDKAARPRRGAPPGRPEAPGAPSGPIGSPGPTSAVGAAIRSLGTPDFPAAFARMAESDFLADQVVVFRAGEQGRVRTLLAENLREGAGRALALAESYASRHWAQDPNRELLLPAGASGEEGRGVVLRAIRVERSPTPSTAAASSPSRASGPRRRWWSARPGTPST